MPIKKIDSFDIAIIGLTANDEEALAALAVTYGHACWSHANEKLPLTVAERSLIGKFKSGLKDQLYKVSQGRFCCFCANKLDDHQATFDLEHLIGKTTGPKVVFNIKNLALSCKTCNGAKGSGRVVVFPLDEELDNVFLESSDYLIVHPHLDIWSDNLQIDNYGRIFPIGDQIFGKGALTIRLYGIEKKNAMQLADHFGFLATDVQSYDDWVSFYVILCSQKDDKKKTKYKRFLNKILTLPQDPAATELKKVLSPLLK